MRLPALLLLPALAAAGCTNVITGEVDGLSIPAMQSAFYIEAEDGYPSADQGEDQGVIIVWMSTEEDACTTVADVLEAQDETDDAEELARIWSDAYPEDFWEATVVLRVADVNESEAGSTFEGTSWDATNEEAGEAFASVTHYLQRLDADFFSDAEDFDQYQDLYYTDGGRLEVDLHEPGDRIGGAFETQAADWDDGDGQGDVTVHFDAERCRKVERVFF